MRNVISKLALVSTFALAACGSGGGGGVSIPRGPVQTLTPLSITIHVPLGNTTAAQSGSRQAKYVSGNTQSVGIALTSWNSIAQSGAPVVLPLTGANCTGSGTSKVCTVNSTAPVGNDIFAVKLYASTDGTGTPLSLGTTVAQAIVAGPNTVALTLDAAVASMAISPASSTTIVGSAGYVAVALNLLDSSGATIIGPGIFAHTDDSALSLTGSCNAGLAFQTSAGAADPISGWTSPAQNTLGRIAYDGTTGTAGGNITCTVTASGAPAVPAATYTLNFANSASVGFQLN